MNKPNELIWHTLCDIIIVFSGVCNLNKLLGSIFLNHKFIKLCSDLFPLFEVSCHVSFYLVFCHTLRFYTHFYHINSIIFNFYSNCKKYLTPTKICVRKKTRYILSPVRTDETMNRPFPN